MLVQEQKYYYAWAFKNAEGPHWYLLMDAASKMAVIGDRQETMVTAWSCINIWKTHPAKFDRDKGCCWGGEMKIDEQKPDAKPINKGLFEYEK